MLGFLQPDNYLAFPEFYIEQDSALLPGRGLIEEAERVLRHEMVSCGIPYAFEGPIRWEYNPTPDGYREWTWQLSRHHEFKLLAEAYRQTGDERYAAGFAELISSWMEQAPLPPDAPSGATCCWRTIEAGIRMTTNWNYAIHTFLASPSVSDRLFCDIIKSVYEHGLRLRGAPSTGNWLIMEMTGLGHIALLYSFFDRAPEWLSFALSSLAEQGNRQLYPDGFQYELSTNYHQVVINNYYWLLDTYRRMDRMLPAELTGVLERAYEVYPRLVMPDLCLPDLNDGSRLPMEKGLREAVRLFPEREDFAYLQSGRQRGSPPAYTSVCLPYSGLAAMRTGWGADDLWCLLEDAPFGKGHQHEDKLEVLLHAYGKDMITEAGTNAYDGSARHRYALSTAGHSTVMVDGQGQNRRGKYQWRDEMLARTAGLGFYTCPGFDAARGVYEEGYGPEYIDVCHERRVILLKDDPRLGFPLVVVLDRLYNRDGKRHRYELLWHLEDVPASLEGAMAVSRHPGGPSLTIACAGAQGWELIRARREPFQGWLADGDPRRDRPAPVAVCSALSDTPLRLATLLLPYPDGRPPCCSVEASPCTEETGLTIHIGRQVLSLDERDYFGAMDGDDPSASPGQDEDAPFLLP